MQYATDLWFSFNSSCVSVTDHSSACVPSVIPRKSFSLIFIHGRLGQAEMWKVMVEGLEHEYRCYSFDLPGFGRSFSVGGESFSLLENTNLALALIRKLTPEGEKVILIGHDVGGGIAQLAALRIPDRVAGLVLINSACLTTKLGGLCKRHSEWGLKRKVKNLIRKAHGLSSPDSQLLWDPWRERNLRHSLTNSFQALEESWPWHYERHIWKEALENLQIPALLLWGEKDEINPPEIGMGLVKNLPEAHFYLDEKSSHWPNLEQPDWVISKVREFLFRITEHKEMDLWDVSSSRKSLSR